MEQLYNNVKDKNENVFQILKSKNGQQQTFMFKDADFQNKNINSLQINNGQFHGCNFTASNIGGCTFNKCDFVKCNFNNLTLIGVTFKECFINECDFTQAIMNDVNFDKNNITKNNFTDINIKNGVTINGQDIIDGKQLNTIIGDEQYNVITDDIQQNKDEINIPKLLDQFKCLQKKDKEYTLNKGNITLDIVQDEGNVWRVMIGYNKDGEFDEAIVSNTIDIDEEQIPSKQEIITYIKNMIKSLAKSAKEKIKTDFIKKSIDEINDQIQKCNITINESVETNDDEQKIIDIIMSYDIPEEQAKKLIKELLKHNLINMENKK